MNTYCLKRGDTLSLTGGAGAEVTLVSGEVWLTQPRDPNDHMLKSGDRMRVAAKGTVLICTFTDARVKFEGTRRAIVGMRRRGEAPGEPATAPTGFAALRAIFARIRALTPISA